MNSALFHNNNDLSFLNNSTYWIKYDNILNGMSSEQKSFVAKNEEVKKKKSVMMAAFVDYLFEQYKDSFVSVQNGAYKPVADEYIETVKKAGDSYISRAEQLETENEELKRQLKEFMNKGKKENGTDKTTADGTGQD